jgi:hypothetical protein
MEAEDLGARAGIRIGTNAISNEAFQDIVLELSLLTRDNPPVAIQATSDAIRLLFAIGK